MRTTTAKPPRIARAALLLVSLVALLTACGEDAAVEQVAPGNVAAGVAVDPESMRGVDVDLGDLSAAEREILLRAKGRRWREVTAAEVAAYLAGEPGREQWLFVWDPATGIAGLRDFQRALDAASETTPRVAVAVVSAAVTDDLVVALRASQVPYPAYRIAPGTAERTEGGALAPGTIYVATAGGDPVTYATVAAALTGSRG